MAGRFEKIAGRIQIAFFILILGAMTVWLAYGIMTMREPDQPTVITIEGIDEATVKAMNEAGNSTLPAIYLECIEACMRMDANGHFTQVETTNCYEACEKILGAKD